MCTLAYHLTDFLYVDLQFNLNILISTNIYTYTHYIHTHTYLKSHTGEPINFDLYQYMYITDRRITYLNIQMCHFIWTNMSWPTKLLQ